MGTKDSDLALGSLANFGNHYSTVCFAARGKRLPPTRTARLASFHGGVLSVPTRPRRCSCSIVMANNNVTNVYTTTATSELKYGITLVGSHPMLNNGGDSRIEIRLKNGVKMNPGSKLKHVVERFKRSGRKGTGPTTGCRSRGGRLFVTGRGGVALCTGCHTVSMGASNGEVRSIVVGRVRGKGRIRLGTPLFSSYAKSNAVKCLTNTSCGVKHRSHARCKRRLTPVRPSGVAVNSSMR